MLRLLGLHLAGLLLALGGAGPLLGCAPLDSEDIGASGESGGLSASGSGTATGSASTDAGSGDDAGEAWAGPTGGDGDGERDGDGAEALGAARELVAARAPEERVELGCLAGSGLLDHRGGIRVGGIRE